MTVPADPAARCCSPRLVAGLACEAWRACTPTPAARPTAPGSWRSRCSRRSSSVARRLQRGRGRPQRRAASSAAGRRPRQPRGAARPASTSSRAARPPWTCSGCSRAAGCASTRSFTPRAPRVAELARTLEQRGWRAAADVLRAAHDPAFLRTLGIEGPSLEGYLFPDTYLLRPRADAPSRCSRGWCSALRAQAHARASSPGARARGLDVARSSSRWPPSSSARPSRATSAG